MIRFLKAGGLALSILVAAAVVAACSSATSPRKEQAISPGSLSSEPSPGMPTNGLVQYSEEGEVAIVVEWKGIENGSLVFYVTMNTHSVDLDQYDLGKLAMLRDNEGNEYRPTFWRSPPGGHHRSGTLAFAPPDSLRRQEAEYLEIVIRDVAGMKERLLRWELG